MTYFFKDVDGRRFLIPELLDMWDKTLRELENCVGFYDLPYVHGERTNVGILATAATKLQYLTLEEYSSYKWKERRRGLGRADLWISSRDGSKELNLEAKYETVSFNSKNLANKIRPHLEDAVKDVQKLRLDQSACPVGILFLRPYNAKPDDFDPTPFYGQLRDKTSYGGDFCALHICETWAQNEAHDGCPGIALVGKYA